MASSTIPLDFAQQQPVEQMSASEEEPILPGSIGQPGQPGHPQGAVRGQLPLAELVHQQGPRLAVLVVGAANGRWRTTMESPSRAGCTSRAALREALADNMGILDGDSAACIVGMAVLEAWRFVHGQASSEDTFHLMAIACASNGQGRTPHFLEHLALATATLVGQPVGLPGHRCAATDSPLICTPPSTMAALSERTFKVTSGQDTGKAVLGIHALLSQWRIRLGTDMAPRPWALWTPMAVALAHGKLSGDVTPLHGRGGHPLPIVHPGRRLMREFRKHPASKPQPPPIATVQVRAPRPQATNRGNVTSFDARHMVNAIRFAENQRNMKKVGKTGPAAMRF